MSNNDEQRIIYDMRVNALRDKMSELDEAEKKGIEKGIKEGAKQEKIANAKNFLNLGIDINIIARGTGLTIEEIKNIELEK